MNAQEELEYEYNAHHDYISELAHSERDRYAWCEDLDPDWCELMGIRTESDYYSYLKRSAEQEQTTTEPPVSFEFPEEFADIPF